MRCDEMRCVYCYLSQSPLRWRMLLLEEHAEQGALSQPYSLSTRSQLLSTQLSPAEYPAHKLKPNAL